MKKKFSKFLGVGLALILVVSFSLVTAVPVSAAVGEPEVTFASDDQAAPALADADYTIKFVTGVALAVAETITIEFPTGTGVAAITGTVEGETISSHVVLGQRVRITVPANADTIAGETVDVLLTAGITNPPDGDYTLTVYTSEEPTAVTSETYVISAAVTSVGAPTLTPATVGAAATYEITFTTSEALRTDDAIVITFPEDTDISAVVGGDVTFDPTATVASATPVGQVLTITLGSNLGAAAQTVTIANITNPTTLLNPDPFETDATNLWRLIVYTTYGHRIPVESATYSITDPATAISQVGWSTVDEYVSNATPSTAFQIETQTGYGTAKNVAAETTFTLTASSGAFYSDAGCTTVITTKIIANGSSESAAFYYKGATATVGTVTITADEETSQGWTMASTTVLVNPKLELWGGGIRVGEYKTFALAMAAALPDDTIKVAPSTYDGFTVNVPDLTIESTAGAATTTIEGTISLGAGADDFTLGGTVDKGFTLQEGTGVQKLVSISAGADDVTISYNTLTQSREGSHAIYTNEAVTDLTVTQNTFTLPIKWGSGIGFFSPGGEAIGLTVTDNDFTGGGSTIDNSAIELHNVDTSSEDTVISGNTFTAMQNGILIGSDQAGSTGLTSDTSGQAILEISGNTFDGLMYAIDLVEAADAGHDHDVVITGNTFTGNTIALGVNKGACPVDADLWEPEDFTVANNDFIGNTYGIYNNADAAPDLPAANNYWGSATGPTISTNADGTGDAVSADVVYAPWLNASGGGSIVTDTRDLLTGWNLISLPLIPIDADIDTVLAGVSTDVTVNKVAYFTGGSAGSWLSWFPAPTPSNLTTMDDGKGYWIDISGTGTLTLTVTGATLALPGQAPPTYDLVAGWNLIGFTSLDTSTQVQVYLGSAVTDTLEAMYGYNATDDVYAPIVPDTTNLVPGDGYWLAVSDAGKIYP